MYNQTINPERLPVELDPSDGHEQLKGIENGEKLEQDIFPEHEHDPARETDDFAEQLMLGKIIRINIPEYQFNSLSNPYSFERSSPTALSPVARPIDEMISRHFDGKDILVRAIQSKHYNLERTQLIKTIVAHGGDFHLLLKDASNTPGEMHALNVKPWTKHSSVLSTLEGFHVYKPKCEELPHYPIDIWMIFDKNAYENIDYLHPRHGVIARDRWRLKDSHNTGLMNVLIIN